MDVTRYCTTNASLEVFTGYGNDGQPERAQAETIGVWVDPSAALITSRDGKQLSTSVKIISPHPMGVDDLLTVYGQTYVIQLAGPKTDIFGAINHYEARA